MCLTAAPDINFVNLGIQVQHLVDGITLPIFGGFKVMFYGLIIGVGIIVGMLIAWRNAKAVGMDGDVIFDFAIYAIIFSVIGARLYYVIFSWDYYKDNLLQIFNTRGGGLAIYGAVIAAVLTLLIYCRVKKVPVLKLADCCFPGLIAGQAIGRWGNFVNCEAFGGYTNNLFAMQIRRSLVNPSMISQELLDHLVVTDGVEYIQVHPTFLYESVWNLGVLAVLLIMLKRKKFDGQIMCLYFLLYGLGRFWIEGLRTDQLILFATGIPVSQLLSAVMVLAAAAVLIWNLRKQKNRRTSEAFDR